MDVDPQRYLNDLGISLNIRLVTREMSVCLLKKKKVEVIATKKLIAFFELIKLVDYVNC